MKEKLIDYHTEYENRMKLLLRDEKKFNDYLFYNQLLDHVTKSKFGSNPKWSEIPIEEKCYHGWLRPLNFTIETIINGRWAFWHDIQFTQNVKEKQIPQLHFYKSYDKEYDVAANMLRKCLKVPYSSYCGSYRTFEYFIDWLLFSFGSSMIKQINHIPSELLKYWYENFNVELLLLYPSDYFVGIATEMYSGRGFNANSFFPTPSSVIECMTQILFCNEDSEKLKYMSCNEPCCGSGTMILYQSNYSLRLSGQDIDLLMTKITNINGYLFIPWLVEMDEKTRQLLENEYQQIN